MMTRFFAAIAILGLLSPFSAEQVSAHEGPPFPVVTDEVRGPYRISVWSDPDIGIGTFFVVIEPTGPGHLSQPDAVTVGVRPVSGRLDEVVYTAEPQQVRYGARYYAEVAFDQGAYWDVRVVVERAGEAYVVETQVEATPDGTIGPVGLIVYLLPFLAVGFLWLKAVRRRRGQDQIGQA